jgi:site-specific DNA-cytosine methylase
VVTPPRAIDLCAGAGGLALGLHRAGWSVLGVEASDVAAATHRAGAGPCVTADIRAWSPRGPSRWDVGWTPWAPVPFVCGGVPCQPFSSQGKRQGLADPRGQLFRHLVRVAVEADARCVMLENVPALAWKGGEALIAIAECMIRAGFVHAFARILNCADYGVPQKRERLIVVAFRDAADAARWAWPAPTHAAPGPDGPYAVTPSGLPPWVTVRTALALPRAARFLAGERKNTGAGTAGRGCWQGSRAIDVDAPGYTVGTRNNADLLVPLDPILDRPARTITSSTHDETPSPPRPGRASDDSRRYGPALRDAIAGTLEALDPETQGAELAAALDRIGMLDRPIGMLDRPSTVVSATARGRLARPGHKAAGDQWKQAVRLTDRACALLQGFPADYPWPSRSDDAHLCIGNAVPPPLGYHLGLAVRRALAE